MRQEQGRGFVHFLDPVDLVQANSTSPATVKHIGVSACLDKDAGTELLDTGDRGSGTEQDDFQCSRLFRIARCCREDRAEHEGNAQYRAIQSARGLLAHIDKLEAVGAFEHESPKWLDGARVRTRCKRCVKGPVLDLLVG